MRRSIVALVVAVACGVVVGGSWPTVAGAGGGSSLRPDREFYRPGDPVHLSAEVYKYDRDWFGPYTVYVRPMDLTYSEPYVQPGERADDVAVGRLVVTRTDDQRVRAEVTFVLPKLADGMYQVSYCSADCTKSLGDLSSSWMNVGTAPYVWPQSVPTTIAAPATTKAPVRSTTSAPRPTSTTSAAEAEAAAPAAVTSAGSDVVAGTDDSEVGRWIVIAVAVLAAVLIAALAVRRGQRRRTITSGIAVDEVDGSRPVVTVDLDRRSVDETIGAGR